MSNTGNAKEVNPKLRNSWNFSSMMLRGVDERLAMLKPYELQVWAPSANNLIKRDCEPKGLLDMMFMDNWCFVADGEKILGYDLRSQSTRALWLKGTIPKGARLSFDDQSKEKHIAFGSNIFDLKNESGQPARVHRSESQSNVYFARRRLLTSTRVSMSWLLNSVDASITRGDSGSLHIAEDMDVIDSVGTRLFILLDSKNVKVIDVRTLTHITCVGFQRQGKDRVIAACSPCGEKVAFASGRKVFIASGICPGTPHVVPQACWDAHQKPVHALAFVGKDLLATSAGDDSTKVWNVNSLV